MKKFKVLLASLIVLCFFATNLEAQSLKSLSKSIKWEQEMCFPCPCANDGQGELLCGTIMFHVVDNGNVIHWNIIGGKLEGLDSGLKYTFSRTSTYKPETGELVLNVRTKGKNGLVTFWQIIGEASFDGEEYDALNGEDVKFYCR